MQKRLVGLAPIIVVATAMGYLCWTHLGDNAPLSKVKPVAKTTDLTAARLSPPPTPDLVRDPFNNGTAIAESTPTKSDPSDKPSGDPVKTAAGNAAHAAKHDSKAHATSSRITFDAGQFVLNGTYIHGPTRMAVINGAIYTEGQLLAAGKSEAPVGTVSQISVDRVELSVNDKTVALTYPKNMKARPRETEPTEIAMGAEPHVTSSVPSVGSIEMPTSMPPPPPTLSPTSNKPN